MFKFNNGRGAVICDKCKIIIVEDLSPKKAKKIDHICEKCKKEKGI